MRSAFRRLSPRHKYLAIALLVGLGITWLGYWGLLALFHVKLVEALDAAGVFFCCWLDFIRPERWS